MEQRIRRPMFWYDMPGHLRIKLEPDEVRISPMGHDAIIEKKLNSKTLKALVPTHTLGENYGWVPADYAGKNGENAILYLPTSNEGRPTWVIPESDLESMLME